MKISHLSLGVSDLRASEKFYRDVLGLATKRDGEDVRVEWPEFLLVLSEKPPTDRSKFHFGFRIDSQAEVDTWAERLRANGVQIISGPATDNGTRQLFFLDPDQYVVEIYASASDLTSSNA
ncbi:MAG TPA: VOC family protein [Candidatus Baltobacteraceae bacterium]|nr:VOC family protein [Candidatus Baltobacteraceae bacterium]